ncbi:hypothetical protein AB6A40_001506 [Gnathostoma spinigerum]|uniref:BTB domain-containing protein n=1 Tax=Gnathostoma spinigerum TaxID=75299 RepID=A0ABD6EE68_9BILA
MSSVEQLRSRETTVSGQVSLSRSLVSPSIAKAFYYDDFSAATQCRTAQIVVEGRTLFVNAGWLAELSPFFASKYFGPNASNVIELSSEFTYDQVLELMQVIFYCPTRKPITVSNLPEVFTLAHRFNMKPVEDRCEGVIKKEMKNLDYVQLVQMTRVLSDCNRNSHTMTMLIDKLSNMKDADLSTISFADVRGDVVADVFAAKMRKTEMKRCCIC